MISSLKRPACLRSAIPPRWIFSFTLIASLSVVAGCGPSAPAPVVDHRMPIAGESTAGNQTATIEIFSRSDADDGIPLVTQVVEVEDTTTIETAMRQIDEVDIVITGSGTTAFVQSIDDVATDASRGWTYTVDNEFATEGIGTTRLRPGQTVRWKFTTFDDAMKLK